MKDIEQSPLPSTPRRIILTRAIVCLGMLTLLSSVLYFVTSTVYESQQVLWADRLWPAVLVLSSLCVLISARAIFRPLKRIQQMDVRLREIIDGMSDGLQIISKDWKYLYVNEVVARQGKSTPERLLGKTMMQAYPGIEQTVLFRELQRCMKRKQRSEMLNEFRFPDGTLGWFRLKIEPVEEGLMILSADVTEQETARQRLEDRMKELEGFIEKMEEFRLRERTEGSVKKRRSAGKRAKVTKKGLR